MKQGSGPTQSRSPTGPVRVRTLSTDQTSRTGSNLPQEGWDERSKRGKVKESLVEYRISTGCMVGTFAYFAGSMSIETGLSDLRRMTMLNDPDNYIIIGTYVIVSHMSHMHHSESYEPYKSYES